MLGAKQQIAVMRLRMPKPFFTCLLFFPGSRLSHCFHLLQQQPPSPGDRACGYGDFARRHLQHPQGGEGLGPTRRLEIHNLGLAVEQLDADIVCLQEVRKMNRREANYFENWPQVGQAEYLAPEGYEAIYRTNAFTKDGEHGNALLSRWPVRDVNHLDVSDYRFEQRGSLHAEVNVSRPFGAVPWSGIWG